MDALYRTGCIRTIRTKFLIYVDSETRGARRSEYSTSTNYLLIMLTFRMCEDSKLLEKQKSIIRETVLLLVAARLAYEGIDLSLYELDYRISER